MKVKPRLPAKGSPELALPDLDAALVEALREALEELLATFADGLAIQLGQTPITPDQQVTAGLNKETDGLRLDPAEVLDGPLQQILIELLGGLELLPIAVSFRWTLSQGPLEGRLLDVPEQAVPEGGDTGSSFRLAFVPQLVEHRDGAPSTAPFTIGVELAFSVEVLGQEIAPDPIALSLPIAVPTIPIPALLALFRHREFAPVKNGRPGFVLLVVAADSPLGVPVSELQPVLETISDSADTVDGVLGLFATGLALPAGLAGLGGLARALRAVTAFAVDGTVVTLENPIENLNLIDLIENPLIKLNDIEGENEISSLILIGPSSTRAELFRRKQLRPDGGKLVVTTGPVLHVRIANLHAREPTGTPDPSLVDVPNPGDVDWELWSNKHFGDSISSLRVTFR